MNVPGLVPIIAAILGSSVLSVLITQLSMRRKLSAEAEKIRADRDSSVVANYQRLIEDMNKLHEQQISGLRERIVGLEMREAELLKQNTLLMEDKKGLLEHYKELKDELRAVRQKQLSYEKALKQHNIPLPN